MSKRHRVEQVPRDRIGTRAHARGERHRIHTELLDVAHQVEAGADPDDVIDPGPAWKPEHGHDVERAAKDPSRRLRHWKVKDWKRRTVRRRARAQAFNRLAQG
jgi:hypothetical protein